MPTRTQVDPKQMPLDLFPRETTIQLAPYQERELDSALAALLLKAEASNAGKTGGER
jgi:hypothetical protein